MTATMEQIAEVLHGHPIIPSPLLGVVECATCGQDYRADREKARQVAALGVGDGEVEYALRVAGDIYTLRDDGRHIRTAAGARRAAREDWAPGVATPVQHTVSPWVEVTDEGGEG